MLCGYEIQCYVVIKLMCDKLLKIHQGNLIWEKEANLKDTYTVWFQLCH